MRDQRAAQHLTGHFLGFRGRLGQTHAAFFAGFGFLELALAAPTGVDLGLDHPERAVQLARGALGVFGTGHDAAVTDRNAIIAQQRLGLVFVDVHDVSPWLSVRTAFAISEGAAQRG